MDCLATPTDLAEEEQAVQEAQVAASSPAALAAVLVERVNTRSDRRARSNAGNIVHLIERTCKVTRALTALPFCVIVLRHKVHKQMCKALHITDPSHIDVSWK